jgi:hypothetical protein
MGNTLALSTPFPRHYDISLVMENVRWELNKEFKRFTTDMLTSYYTNRVDWPAMLVVTGGGASLNGDILRLSLEEVLVSQFLIALGGQGGDLFEGRFLCGRLLPVHHLAVFAGLADKLRLGGVPGSATHQSHG